MSVSAKRRLEDAVRTYLHANSETLADVQMLVSKDQETNTLPRLHIVALGMQTTDGFEGTDELEKTATLAIEVLTSPDDDTDMDADLLVAEAERLLGDVEAFRESADASTGIHIYGTSAQSSEQSVIDRTQSIVFTYQILLRDKLPFMEVALTVDGEALEFEEEILTTQHG